MTASLTSDRTPAAEPPDAQPEAFTIVERRPIGRWIASVIVLILLAQVINGLFTNPNFDLGTFASFLLSDSIVRAVGTTLQLTLIAGVLGFLGGIVLALGRLSKSPLLSSASWTFVWLFRSVPLLVQVLFFGFLGALYAQISIGIPFGPIFHSWDTRDLIAPFVAGAIGLTLHQAAYNAEIIRSGILSVDSGQLEAASALGIPRGKQFRLIIFPQAMRTIVPPAVNQIIDLLKGTSAVFVLAIPDLFYQSQVIYGRNGRIIALLLVATVWYIFLTAVLSILQYYVERYFSKGSARNLEPTPRQRIVRAVRAWRLRREVTAQPKEATS